MKISKEKRYAVVTGDVVASSRLTSARRRRLHEAMLTTSRALRAAFKKAVPVDVDVFRGDSFQMVIVSPHVALRAALFYRASLRARMESHRFDIRLALAVGRINFIPNNRVSEGDGEAFQLSGKALESMSRTSGMSFSFPGQPEEQVLSVVVQLVDSLAAQWSDKQALAITGALRGWNQQQIAKTCWKRPISQQAVNQHLSRAHWSSVNVALEFFEKTVQALVDSTQVN